MKIVLINGNPIVNNYVLDNYLDSFCKQAKQQNIEASIFNLREMKINYCSGCWSCWWKTPGICSFNDDMPDLYKAYLNADLVVFASPIIKGFESALLKKVKDRLIPILHPYIEFRENECHHKKRYTKYPPLGYLTQKENDTDSEDMELLHEIQKRYALNFHSQIVFFETISKPVNILINEIINNQCIAQGNKKQHQAIIR